MALKALHKCTYQGCNRLVRDARCDEHNRDKHLRNVDNTYHSLYGRQWRKHAARYRKAHPTCVACESRGEVSAAYCVDHIHPHKGDERLFWDEGNWQSLCERCHNEKTARERTALERNH